MEILRRSLRTPFKQFTRPIHKNVNFNQYIHHRRSQAEKSILIQVGNLNSAHEIESHLSSNYGPLESIYLYTLPAKGKGPTLGPKGADVLWVLAEFQEKNSLERVVDSSRHTNGSLPFKSPMCWFSGSNKSSSSSSNKPSIRDKSSTNIKESLISKIEKLSEVQQPPDFSKAKSLTEQMELLADSLKLTELGIRVRFLVAHQLEKSFEKFFPIGCVIPFGSSVSGIGRQSGDLDLVLIPDKAELFPEIKELDNKKDSKLWLQTKLTTNSNTSSARFQVQRVMESLADLIQLFVPGCYHVQRILQARVPILRFWSEFTDLQCDLSMTNSSGVYMSELLYLMCCLDKRFPTLLCSIRSWAAARKITNQVPGRQPTNFMLVLLLLHFLQVKKILPTFDILFNNPEHCDNRVTADGIDCSFLRSPVNILNFFKPSNTKMTSAELLFEFFEFYSEFDFASKGISLFTKASWGKPDSGPLYIQNPLEKHLNVARNVSKEEVVRFKSECCSALWKLETSHSKEAVSLKDILLTPQLDKSIDNSKIKMRDLLAD